jgi:hypothetical protein
VEAMTSDPALVSKAIVVWVGWGKTPIPWTDDQRVVKQFGEELARLLLPEVNRLSRDFFSSDAHTRVRDLAEKGRVAAEQFRSRHPEISDEAVKALEWTYTYNQM